MNDTDVNFKTLVQGRAGVQHKGAGPETKEFSALFVKSVDTKNRRITALASTGSLDRHDEAIRPEAFKDMLPVYMQNPVVITSHQHRLNSGHSSVVANVVKAWIDEKGLWVIIEFVQGTALGDEYWQLYSTKKQRAFSVGFVPMEWEYEERDGKRVCVYTKVELLEISCVPVGANPEAISRSKQRKIAWLDEKKQPEVIDEIERELLEIEPDADLEYERKNAEQLVELWIGDKGETPDDEIDEKSDFDCAGIIKGTRCGEFAKIFRRQ